MEHFVLDTNVFFNMEAGLGLGQKTEQVIRIITQKSIHMKQAKKGEIYVPPRVLEEILSFFEDKEQLFLKEFAAAMTIKSPAIHNYDIGVDVLYELINDIRNRNYRGLTIGEEEIKNTARAFEGKTTADKKDFEITVGTHVKHFRDRYRQATRLGFLDSVTDMDVIMLAKELDGYVVSTDEGVIKWARIFGVREIPPSAFVEKLNNL